ncbi:MAG TPA: hypothetical protein PKE29_00435 [Phycisphaerales bacterium]|nr:hypothetical protein [Phycisphaerales bacterium]
MAYFPVEAWVAFSVVGAAGILAILSVLAKQFQHFRSVHDLRVEATGLRRGYAARLAEMRAREAGEVIEVGEMVDDTELKFPVADEKKQAA